MATTREKWSTRSKTCVSVILFTGMSVTNCPKVGTQSDWIYVYPIHAISEAGGNKFIFKYINPPLKFPVIVTKWWNFNIS